MPPTASSRTRSAPDTHADESESRYRDLALASDQAVILAVSGRITFVNDAAVGLLGAVQPDQLLDRPLADFASLPDEPAGQPEAGARAAYTDSEFRRLDEATVEVSYARLPCRVDGQPAVQLVVRDLAGRRQLERQIQFLSRHDILTEIPNRTEFRDRLEGAMARAQRNARQVAVMMLNLDGFKHVNSQHGPDVGDAVLQAVALRLKESVRKADSVARVAGDEFGLILEAIDQREQAAVVANRVLQRLKEPIEVGGAAIQISASAGVAAFPSDAKDLESLLRMTDVAMYAARDAGGGNFRFYFPELEAMSQRDQLRREQTAKRMSTLTDREREVMDVLIEGNSNKSIAYLLGASPRTIENHRARVMEKMQADSLPDLVRMVLELKQRK